MHSFITNWTTALNVGKLPPHMNFQATTTRILRTLSYPLPATSLSTQECVDLESALYRTTLPKCGISSKLPLAIRYGTHRHMGLGMTQFHTIQGIHHLREFVEKYRGQNIMSQQILLSYELIQTTIGTRSWCFDYSASSYSHLVDIGWVRTVWEFTFKHNIQLQAPHPILNLPREHDIFLMETFISHGCNKLSLQRLNHCRLYLQVITLSDIVDASGRRIL